ncbi:MAG TPA: flagellar motor switch protein FliN [Bryobacteraceae bacterium]|nr:flagellar motor switch protein FliN [Bryobacteraceae bacterium]
MPQQDTPTVRSWLADEWATQITHVMESMTGEAPSVAYAPHEVSTAEIDPNQTELVWWEQRFSNGPEAIAWIGAATESWEEIGNRVLKSAGVDDGDQETIRSTYLEIVSQALSGVASAISKRARRETSCLEGRTAPPESTAEFKAYRFQITFGEQAFQVLTLFSKSIEDLPETPPETSQPKALPPAAKPSAEEIGKSHSIDLLLDVELPVSVSFGRAQLPLKDVIKLTTGSIIELNRSVSEPVEVIVNNCVIARGEVVVVEGNFGVRIRQVISRKERLRTLT